MNKLNDKCSFKINMFTYLIMTALLNTAVSSKISLTGDSCPEEASQFTYRASQLAGFCSMRAATEGYFGTDHTSKKKLLLNLLFFIVCKLAISADHHPTLTMIVHAGYFLSFKDAG